MARCTNKPFFVRITAMYDFETKDTLHESYGANASGYGYRKKDSLLDPRTTERNVIPRCCFFFLDFLGEALHFGATSSLRRLLRFDYLLIRLGEGFVLPLCYAFGSKASGYESADFAFATNFAHL